MCESGPIRRTQYNKHRNITNTARAPPPQKVSFLFTHTHTQTRGGREPVVRTCTVAFKHTHHMGG